MAKKNRLSLSCDREKMEEKKMSDLIEETLSGPVAVFPKWTENNHRVRVLQSIFTIDGIFKKEQNQFYEPHMLKIELDSSCIKDIVRCFSKSAAWAQVRNLESMSNEKEFKERQSDFEEMTGGFH